MRYRAVTGFHSQRHAQSIASAEAVGELHFAFHLTIRSRLQQLLVHNRDIPPREIFRSHREFACCEEPTLSFFWRGPQWTKRVTKVANRIVRLELRHIHAGDALHAERRKDFLLHK